MTIEEVLAQITSESKYYVPHFNHNTASMIVRRIREGTAKRSTIRRFFNKFGYKGDFNEWQLAETVQQEK